MERLGASDLEGTLRFMREASAETGPEPFPAHVLERLRGLVGCEWASYCELDRRHRRLLALIESPLPDDLPDAEATFWRLVDQHPLCEAQRRGRFDAVKLSDFHNRRELRRLEIYHDWFRPSQVEFEMEVGIPSPLEHTKTFLFDAAQRDFGERDRTLLNLLQPHLAQLYRAAAVRREATAACAALEAGGDAVGHGVLVLDARGAIEVASAEARRLLAAHLPGGTAARLPAMLARWVEGQRAVARAGRSPAAFTFDGRAGTLIAELSARGANDVVVLSELRAPGADPVALTDREHEVLRLVRDGLRNAEIAQALWISPSTVRKHLENIYDKLGVHTRTAAVARIHGTD